METVLFSKQDGIGRIAINRPEKSNALNREMIRSMSQKLRAAGEDPEVRLIALTGAGEKTFCAGIDLQSSLSQPEEGEDFGRSDFRQLLMDIVQFPKPTVALVRGHVMGGGMGLLLASDLCLACEDVRFSTPEIRVGMFPMMVMALLYRNVGRKKATEMMFMGEQLTAGQAREFGIINHFYSRESFDSESGRFLQKLTQKSISILQMGKEAISRLLDDDLWAQEKFLESALSEVMSTPDSKEGIRAFIEKRPPKWN